MKSIFWADFATEDETLDTIRRVFNSQKYLLDTHSAVAWNVAEKYQNATGDHRPLVVVSTASPYKFSPSVLQALGKRLNDMDEFKMLERLHEISEIPIPKHFVDLKSAAEIHTSICEKNEMEFRVERFANP